MKHIIGVDFGGTKINTVLINEKGEVLKRIKVKTRKNRKEAVKQILESIERVIDNKTIGIGIGVPGVLNAERTEIINLPNITGPKKIKLKEIIEKKTKKKVLLENDANCMALAESFFGHGKGVDSFVCLTLGTGIGSGIFINGKLYKGRGSAGQISETIINNQKLEKYVLKDKKNLGKKVGITLTNITKILDPELIVIGGGLSNLGKKILVPAKKEMKKHFSIKIPEIKVVKLKDDAGAIGAGSLFL